VHQRVRPGVRAHDRLTRRSAARYPSVEIPATLS
jgi:hypothetical protein